MKNFKFYRDIFNDNINGADNVAVSQEEATDVVMAKFNEEAGFLAEINSVKKEDPERAAEEFVRSRVEFINAYIDSICDGEDIKREDIHFVLRQAGVDDEMARYTPLPDVYGSKHRGVMILNFQAMKKKSVYELAYFLDREFARAYFSNQKIDNKKGARSYPEDGTNKGPAFVSNMYDKAHNYGKEEAQCRENAYRNVRDLISKTVKKYGESDYLKKAERKMKDRHEEYAVDRELGSMILPLAKLCVAINDAKKRKIREDYPGVDNSKYANMSDEKFEELEEDIRDFESRFENYPDNLDENGDYNRTFGSGHHITQRSRKAAEIIAFASERIGLSMDDVTIGGFSDAVDKVAFVDVSVLPEYKLSGYTTMVVIPERYLGLNPKHFVDNIVYDIKTEALDKMQDENE